MMSFQKLTRSRSEIKAWATTVVYPTMIEGEEEAVGEAEGGHAEAVVGAVVAFLNVNNQHRIILLPEVVEWCPTRTATMKIRKTVARTRNLHQIAKREKKRSNQTKQRIIKRAMWQKTLKWKMKRLSNKNNSLL